MRKYSGMILFFVLIMLIVPAFALIGQNSGTILWNTPNLDVPDFSSLTPTEYQENRFYLIQNHKTGEIMALSPADYVKGVVAAEMPVSFHTEALKAQAVAAHTYALRQISQQLDSPSSDLKGAYLSTDPAKFQAYLSPEELRKKWGKNYDLYWKKLSDAVDSVINEVIVCDGEPIIAAFHSISSGMTESAENVWGQDVSYLEPVKSEGDELSPEFETASVLKEAEVAHALLAKFPGIKLSEDRSRWLPSPSAVIQVPSPN